MKISFNINSKTNYFFFTFLSLLFPVFVHSSWTFIAEPDDLKPFYGRTDILMLASPGRSGSTLMSSLLDQYASNYTVIKTHILPPDKRYKGKIIFIYSNPDKAAESVLHLTINSALFGSNHFKHLQSSDKKWLEKIGNTSNQTYEDNLLSYDALGCHKQLMYWLFLTIPATKQDAQILAIKYENLWDIKTINKIKKFINSNKFEMPPKRERGYKDEELDKREIEFKNLYNLGSGDNPCYAAYNRARFLWKLAPKTQYLKLK
jgi:hypothetical protein